MVDYVIKEMVHVLAVQLSRYGRTLKVWKAFEKLENSASPRFFSLRSSQLYRRVLNMDHFLIKKSFEKRKFFENFLTFFFFLSKKRR